MMCDELDEMIATEKYLFDDALDEGGDLSDSGQAAGCVAPLCHMKPMRLDTADDYPNGQVTYWECEVCGHTKEYSRNPPRV
jgi:rubrerythrin